MHASNPYENNQIDIVKLDEDFKTGLKDIRPFISGLSAEGKVNTTLPNYMYINSELNFMNIFIILVANFTLITIFILFFI